MKQKIYKYLSSNVIDLVFQREGYAGIKFSFPSDYNDPYELFLGVDTNVDSALMASYQDIVQEIPQWPTTCFSVAPVITPMWAHYAQNHSGFVLEFDIKSLKNFFDEAIINEIEYKDSPDKAISESLRRAAMTKKPRHATWLTQTVFSEAYFSKQSTWSYERECRFVDTHGYTEEILGNMILFAPIECISSIIIGKNSSTESIDKLKTISETFKVELYTCQIGRSYPYPFFNSASNDVFLFENDRISKTDIVCEDCSEPLIQDLRLCAWCRITEADRQDAASANPFRILDHHGLLGDYFQQVAEIEKKRR